MSVATATRDGPYATAQVSPVPPAKADGSATGSGQPPRSSAAPSPGVASTAAAPASMGGPTELPSNTGPSTSVASVAASTLHAVSAADAIAATRRASEERTIPRWMRPVRPAFKVIRRVRHDVPSSGGDDGKAPTRAQTR
jgi:hypothetical protein